MHTVCRPRLPSLSRHVYRTSMAQPAESLDQVKFPSKTFPHSLTLPVVIERHAVHLLVFFGKFATSRVDETQPTHLLEYLHHSFPDYHTCLPFIAAMLLKFRDLQAPGRPIYSTTLFVPVSFLSALVAGTKSPSCSTQMAPSMSTVSRHYSECACRTASLLMKTPLGRSSPSPFATFTSSAQSPRHSSQLV
jgi:hypothetical protein